MGGEVDAIYMDFAKAFDSVPHKRLLHKINNYGISGNILSWIKDFLTTRHQRVGVYTNFSSWNNVQSGIPQGSVLGPLLFVIYINDLPENIKSSILMFADDTKLYRKIDSNEDYTLLQKDLDILQNWSDTWLLKFNPDKCKTLTIGKSKVENDRRYSMKINESPNSSQSHNLEKVKEEKDLGIIIDDRLNFEKHINTKVNKANQIMGLIRRTFSFLNESIFLHLYKSIVRPHLEYAVHCWHPMRKKDISSIENVQRRATRMVPTLKGLTYPQRLQKLKIPTLVFRRMRGDMIETFKILTDIYDKAASPILEFVSQDIPTRGHKYKLRKKHHNTRIHQHFFSSRIIDAWNSLPNDVVEAPTLNSFKNKLDKY